jgi:hypothetical protein
VAMPPWNIEEALFSGCPKSAKHLQTDAGKRCGDAGPAAEV